SRAMPSAFVAGSCRQNSTSLAIVPTHATNTRPTQIHTKQANQSNAYGASIGRHKLLLRGGQFDKPKDGFGPCRFVALFSCPGVQTFTQFGRKTDGRYGIIPGGATAFLCTRGHMLPFFSPLSSTDPAEIFNPREGRRRLPGAYALWAVRARCAGRDCVHPRRQ